MFALTLINKKPSRLEGKSILLTEDLHFGGRLKRNTVCSLRFHRKKKWVEYSSLSVRLRKIQREKPKPMTICTYLEYTSQLGVGFLKPSVFTNSTDTK